MEHELAAEQFHGGVIELKKPIPLEDAGPLEWHRESNAKHELD
jgi:hypothetical protein